MAEIIKENLAGTKIKRIRSFQKPVLDIFSTLTNNATEQLIQHEMTVESFSGTPKIILQIDRDVIELPASIETSEQLEEYVIHLLDNEKLTIKLEIEGLGGIFRWFPSKESLLLVATYVVDSSRAKFKRLPSTHYPIHMRVATGDNPNRASLGKIIYAVLYEALHNEREQLDVDYKRFLDRAFRPFVEFLYNERLSIRDPKFRPKAPYRKRKSTDDYDRVFLEVNLPPRQLTEGGNAIAAEDERGNTYLSVRVADYDESEGLIIIEEGLKTRDWPDEGNIYLEGDMASNRRKTHAVNLLRTRKNPIYAKLADVLVRPWGLSQVDRLDRSYFHPNISHDNPISVAQAQAVDLALSNSDVSLIHGPPGTGKTTVIVEIIRHVTSQGGRVLMVAPTHVAVDNVLERIANERGIAAVRVGGRQYMSNELKKFRLQDRVREYKDALPSFHEGKGSDRDIMLLQRKFIAKMEEKDKRFFENLVLEQSNLVCGTTIGIAHYYENTARKQINFDVLIIDEASKATVIEFLVPAVRARKWVLVGDHRQLPPYVNDQELRIFIQRYFDTDEKNTSDFHEKTDELVGSLRRYHEEMHALSEGDPELHWQRIIELFNYDRKIIKSIEEMIKLALGSCFHYFLQQLDSSRNVYLSVQHRMPSILANFLDEAIYAGNLKTSTSAAEHGLLLPAIPELGLGAIDLPLAFLSTENYPRQFESEGRRKGYRNLAEAEAITDIIATLITMDARAFGYTDENPMTIGVITYYADQSYTIRNKLSSIEDLISAPGWRFKLADNPIVVRVSIVDRFQGQEQDIVLLSLTRSNKHGRIGFLKNLQRINVSLSRAKQNLLVVGDHKFFSRLRVRNHPIILKELATYCEKHNLVRKIKT